MSVCYDAVRMSAAPLFRELARWSVVSSIVLLAGCATFRKAPAAAPTQPAAQNVPAPPAPAIEPARDPVADLIVESEGHFKAGQDALELGHVEAARTEFDRAVNVLLESAYGGRTENWFVIRVAVFLWSSHVPRRPPVSLSLSVKL